MTDLRIAIGPSMMLAVALGAAHFAAGGLLWLVPIPGPGKAVFTLAIAGSLVYFMARDALLHAPQSIVALELRDSGSVSLQTRRGEWIEGDVLGSSYVSPFLTVINFRPLGQRGARHVILLSDNLDPRDSRRLRMWLRWKWGEGGGPAAAGEKN